MENLSQQEAQKLLDEFDKDFHKLLAKYPDLFVGGGINGEIVAFTTVQNYKTISKKITH